MSNKVLSRRAFLQLSAMLTAGGMLSACAPAVPGGSSLSHSAAAPEVSEINIVVQGWVDAAWKVSERAAIYNAGAAEGVQVNIIPVPEGWETKALSQIEQGAPLWDGELTHHPFRVAVQWLGQGLIMPIDEYLAASAAVVADEYWSSTIAPDLIQFDCAVNGKVVGIPIGIDTCCQGFHAELMKAAGLPYTRKDFMQERSWANLQRWAEILREKYKGENVWGITTWEVYHQSLGAIFQSIATDLYYEDEGLIRFDSEEMQQALAIQAQWSRSGVAPVPAWGQPGEVTDLFPGGRSALWQGQLGIVARGQRVLGIEVIPYAMPVQVEGGTGGNQWYTTCGYVLNHAQHPQEVVDFYLWMFGPQNDEHAQLTLQYNWFPIFRTHWNKYIEGGGEYAWVKDFLPQIENADLIPRNPYYEIEQSTAKKYCELAQADKLSVKEACQMMMAEVREQVARL